LVFLFFHSKKNFKKFKMAHANKLEPTSADNTALDLKIELHKSYIIGLQSKKSSFEYAATEHLRMSAIYWGLTAMDLMSAKDMMACEEIIAWVMKCQHPSVRISYFQSII
jgi:prenyltransferase beta subunit